MSMPQCEYCSAKFPGDPCNRCGLPAGLSPSEVRRLKVGQAMVTLNISKKAAKAHLGRARKRRNKPGRVGVKR